MGRGQRSKSTRTRSRLKKACFERRAIASLCQSAAMHAPQWLQPHLAADEIRRFFRMMTILSRSQVKALYDQDATWSDPITECNGLDSIEANFASLALVAAVCTLHISPKPPCAPHVRCPATTMH
jgi:hypothetical protein